MQYRIVKKGHGEGIYHIEQFRSWVGWVWIATAYSNDEAFKRLSKIKSGTDDIIIHQE